MPETTTSSPAETPESRTGSKPAPKTPPEGDDTETALESLSSICTVLAVGLFVMTFIFQNFEIPSASMEKTLLIGDHVLVDRVTLAPPTHWFPLVHYREPRRGDI
ncbi:MAG TPA: S26 family signal peptidase, partial [Acidobacteriaceae bacterium]|nr:S26 family signal peptidase [Acidobacteriaceae bacterium]